jgi:hypothetical protein
LSIADPICWNSEELLDEVELLLVLDDVSELASVDVAELPELDEAEPDVDPESVEDVSLELAPNS